MRDDQENPDETSRLLDVPPPPASRSSPDPWRTILSVAAFTLILGFSSDIGFVPQTAILQDIVCRQYYALHTPDLNQSGPVDRCLIEPVQSEVAYINGWKDSLEILPAMLLALPYGALADRIGRKPVLLLAVIGCFANDVWTRVVYWFPDIFPLRLVWLGGLGQAIGSGGTSLSSLTFVLVADVAPVDQRTTAFSYIQSAAVLSKVIFVPIGGALSEINPWLPMLISSLLMIISFLVLLVFVPETLQSASDGPENDSEGVSTPILGVNGDSGTNKIIDLRLQEQLANVKRFGQWMVRNIRVGLLSFCFFLILLGEQTFGSLLLQYTEKRLGWSLSKASYLFSLGAGVGLLNLLVLIPATSAFLLRRFNLHEIAKDKLIAQASGVFLVVGSVIVFLARSWVVLVIGQLLSHIGYAFTLPVRSIVTSMVEQKHFAALYMGISVLTYAGVLAGNPMCAGLYKWGMRLGDFWMGMPWLVAGGCFSVALLIVSTVTATTKSGGYERVTEDEEEDGVLGEGEGTPL